MLPERSFGELLDRARACHTHQDLSQFPRDACGAGLRADSSAGALALGSWTTGYLKSLQSLEMEVRPSFGPADSRAGSHSLDMASDTSLVLSKHGLGFESPAFQG